MNLVMKICYTIEENPMKSYNLIRLILFINIMYKGG
jgi:hypothetical protein